MKVTIFPGTWIGRMLVSLKVIKPTEIEFDFSSEGKFTVKSNKPRLLGNIIVTFEQSFDSKTIFKI